MILIEVYKLSQFIACDIFVLVKLSFLFDKEFNMFLLLLRFMENQYNRKENKNVNYEYDKHFI